MSQFFPYDPTKCTTQLPTICSPNNCAIDTAECIPLYSTKPGTNYIPFSTTNWKAIRNTQFPSDTTTIISTNLPT